MAEHMMSTDQFLRSFFQPIVNKEKWFKRELMVIKTHQEELTEHPLLCNSFIHSVDSSHNIHELDKRKRKDVVDQELRKKLRPDKQSFHEIPTGKLPKTGSIQFEYSQAVLKTGVQRKKEAQFSCQQATTAILSDRTFIPTDDDQQSKKADTQLNDIQYQNDNLDEKISFTTDLTNKYDASAVSSCQIYNFASSRTDIPQPETKPVTSNIPQNITLNQTFNQDIKDQILPLIAKSEVFVSKKEAGNSEFTKAQKLWDKAEHISHEKSSKDTASSSWTLRSFHKHVSIDQFTLVDSITDNKSLLHNKGVELSEFMMLRQQLTHESAISGFAKGDLDVIDASCFAYLHHEDTKEAMVKLFLNPIITTVCHKKNLTVHHEYYMGDKTQFKISPRCDCVLEYYGNIIGSIEIKAPIKINKNAMVQLMLQLLKIQYHKQDPSRKYLGVLSDGYKYVLVVLQGNHFTLEKDGGNHKRDVVKVHKACKWSDVMEIVNILCAAVSICIQTWKGDTLVIDDSADESVRSNVENSGNMIILNKEECITNTEVITLSDSD